MLAYPQQVSDRLSLKKKKKVIKKLLPTLVIPGQKREKREMKYFLS